MKFEKTRILGLEMALVGMRLPMTKSFSTAREKCSFTLTDPRNEHRTFDNGLGVDYYSVDKNTLEVAKNLCKADEKGGSQPNSKFLRMIHVQTCITAPVYFINELDTYKIGTTKNSTSLQHTGMKRDFTVDDFELDTLTFAEGCIIPLLDTINHLRKKYIETKNYAFFRAVRQLLPMSYNYTFMFDVDYATLRNMYHWRKNHKLKEWSVDFVEWCKTLPYFEEFIEN